MASQELIAAANELKTMGGDSLLLCAARRQSLKPVIMLREFMLGALYPAIAEQCAKGAAAEQAREQLVNNPELNRLLDQKKMDANGFAFNYVVMRHLVNKAPIFTVSPALHLMLEDTGVKENIPVKFFAAPAATCYIEFVPPELRLTSPFRTFAEGRYRICEGCYVQESRFDKLPALSSFARQSLELDPNMPVRQVNIGFSACPVDPDGQGSTRSGAGLIGDDTVDYFTFYIQGDEDLGEMFERHLRFYAMRNEIEGGMSDYEFSAFTDNFKRNLMHLSKIFFYLNVDKRQQLKINDASELEARIGKVAEKKQRKLIQQLSRVYDRIVVGPKDYTPISKRLQSGDLPKGTVRPHYRRGYFGIRHVGSGQAKHAELVRVKEALINPELLNNSDITPKQYEVR